MTQTTFGKVIIISLVCITLALIGIIFYLINTKQSVINFGTDTSQQNIGITHSTQDKNQSTSSDSNSASSKTRSRINLGSNNMPLAYSFELPIGYKAYLVEGREGGYGARITILREEAEHIYKNAGIELWITGESQYNDQGTEGDAVIERIVKNHGPYVTRTTFLGNKAVEVKGEMIDGSLQTIGYIKNTRVPNYPYVVVASYIPTYIGDTALPVDEYRNILKTLQVIVKENY